MHSTSILPCIMTMISNFINFFIYQIFIFKFLFTYITDLCVFILFLLLFANNYFFFSFLKLIIFIACFLKDLKIFSCHLYLCIHRAYFCIFLNDNIGDIEKPDGVCLLTFVSDEFSGLILHPSIFSIIHLRST